MTAPRRFRVVIEAHTVTARMHLDCGCRRYYALPASEHLLPESTPERAMATAIRWAHIDAGVPPSRRLLRQSAHYATATVHVGSKEEQMREGARR
jgi:hypothetical protein